VATATPEMTGTSKAGATGGHTAPLLGDGTSQAVSSDVDGDEPELSPALQAWNSGQNLQANLSGSATLAARLSHSEMNIALQADALGAVQVRARVTGDQVGATITVERHDTHAALSGDLPALHQALNERHLRLETFSLQQGLSADASGSNAYAGRQQAQQGSSHPNASSGAPPLPFDTAETTPGASRTVFDSQGRLSVRA
jgi:flagellar hook-length control protein FliK